MKILFITIPEKYASTRLRVLNYLPYLVDIEYTHIVGSPHWSMRRKILFGIKILAMAPRYDLIFLHKLLLPPLLTQYLARSTPLVYDFDDAVYLDRPWQDGDGNGLTRLLVPTLKESTSVIVSTPELRSYTEQYTDDVYEIPTPIPRERYEQLRQEISKLSEPTIGWIGHPENLFFLERYEDVISEVLDSTEAQLRIITSENHELSPLENRNDVEYVTWTRKTGERDIGECHCAIRPLTDSPWTRAKCHTSVIQPMALGLPVVVSPVGILGDILADNSGGVLARKPEDWISSVARLFSSESYRLELGERAVQRIEEIGFWTENQAQNFRLVLEETTN